MWKKIKEILCKHTVYKDEPTNITVPDAINASVVDLKSAPTTPLRRPEILNQNHRPYRNAIRNSTLNKTDEHCRSLLSLLPTSLRSRHHHQTSNNKGVNASSETATTTTTTTNKVTTTTQVSPSFNRYRTDYDSGYMSQSILNRTSSHASCYSAVASTVPLPSIIRYGSIENLLYGHSKSNPANVHVFVRKTFEPFSQAHIAVKKGTIVTALFARGPWLYIRKESNGQTGYIPRIICSLHKSSNTVKRNENYHHRQQHNPISTSSTDSSSNKDDELDLTRISSTTDKYFIRPYKQQPINRHLSYSSAVINEQQNTQEQSTKTFEKVYSDERERRYTCNVPTATLTTKDRRLTVNSINWPLTIKNFDVVGIHETADVSTTTANNIGIQPTRDTDSSSTQDSGYSESTPYFLVQQAISDVEQVPITINPSKQSNSSPHYATVRRSSLLNFTDSMNAVNHTTSLRRRHYETVRPTRTTQYRHTILNDLPINDTLTQDTNKRHSFGTFYSNDTKTYDHLSAISKNSSITSRPIDSALIRHVRHEKHNLYQQVKPTVHNLPKSHRQIPENSFLNHHRQQHKQQQFGSSHSAFRPVQSLMKISKRASSEGHSPSSEHQQSSSVNSTSSSSLSLSTSKSSSLSSSLANIKISHSYKQRRLSCDLPNHIIPKYDSTSLTRSVCDQTSTKKLNKFSRTMSDILCDQFSEINLDAIEKDSLVHPITNKMSNIQHNVFTITKDYRSSRASFSVKRGDYVHILKQVGRACYLVRKQNNGQIGFLPKALIMQSTTTKVDTFLEMHGYRETVI